MINLVSPAGGPFEPINSALPAASCSVGVE